VHNINGSANSTTVLSEDDSFAIEDLDACVDYEVSVSAVNEYNQSSSVVTDNTTTETAGNYLTQFISLLLLCGCE
jgi:hypothetical protein